jgi:hypothetical protein
VIEIARNARNAEMLLQLHPVFGARVLRLIGSLEAVGFRPRIQQAFRSLEEQAANKASGASEVIWSFHNAIGKDGQPEALAVDLLDDDYPLRPRMRYVMRMAIDAAALQLETGILWGLAEGPRERLVEAITSRKYDWVCKPGWDPCHVQPADVTLLQAKHGLRPAA